MAEPTAPENRLAFSATRTNVQRLVIESSRKSPVLVDFWAPWAGPSLRQGELLRRLAAEYGGRFLLVSVDTDREKTLAEELGVKSLPSCRPFRHGRVVKQIHGVQAEAEIEVGLAIDPGPLTRAARALVADDYDEALEELADIHHRDPSFRNGIGRRGLIALLEQPGPNDPRAGTYRRLLFQH